MTVEITEFTDAVLVGQPSTALPHGPTVYEFADVVLVSDEEGPDPPPPDCCDWIPSYVWTGEACGWRPLFNIVGTPHAP